jgi:GTP pyrophosphokinase
MRGNKMEKELEEKLSYLPKEYIEKVKKAYEYAKNAHYYQTRASGENYFDHCAAAALNLCELKMDCATLCAALLHDILEDTLITKKELEENFGKEIAGLVDGVTKLSKYQFEDKITAQAENWRKMLLAVVKDIRVILVKLADRLHNIRTLNFLSPEKQISIASESIALYAPFAHRLGIYKWKSEIEDICFKILQPKDYEFIKIQWEKRDESNLENLNSAVNKIKEKLLPAGIEFKISSRPKNLYGIYKKMQRQNKPFSEIQDLAGLRIITDTVEHCYEILSVLNSNFKLLEGSFTDYINIPKANMYQSLHLTVITSNGSFVETQIRTEEMHMRCEYGIAAHWKYKQKVEGGSNGKANSKMDLSEDRLDWLKQFLEYQKENSDPKEFLNSLKTECEFEQIFVFTPQKKVIKLPIDSTALDFAYSIHSDIGNSFMGAKVNGKMANIDTKLKTGDTCEILTRKNAKPTPNWLKFAITSQARAKIRHYLREHQK